MFTIYYSFIEHYLGIILQIVSVMFHKLWKSNGETVREPCVPADLVLNKHGRQQGESKLYQKGADKYFVCFRNEIRFYSLYSTHINREVLYELICYNQSFIFR